MKIQYCSDLHLEFPANYRYLKQHPLKPVGDVLVIAGDFYLLSLKYSLINDFLSFASDNFQEVYWVPGNHEYYNSEITKWPVSFQENIRSNFFLLNNKVVIKNDVHLIFSTLWGDIPQNLQWFISQNVSDFHVIRHQGKKFTPAQFNSYHKESLSFIKKSIKIEEKTKKVVISHHVPTNLNYPVAYEGSLLNSAFAIELSAFIEKEGLKPRATKDIDIILMVEALSPDFVKQFWKFIADGQYKNQGKSSAKKLFYRFYDPSVDGFPRQIELFARVPDLLDLPGTSRFTPIPVDEDLSSLSAILLNEDYYSFTMEHCSIENILHLANIESLICLKAKAFLDLSLRKKSGETIDAKKILKHKTDIFRLASLVPIGSSFYLPDTLKANLSAFIEAIQNNLPDKSLFREMGLGNTNLQAILDRLLLDFNLSV